MTAAEVDAHWELTRQMMQKINRQITADEEVQTAREAAS